MNYKMEELVPIVGKLAKRYNGWESTSMTYEKAEQLMGAVIYCIREAELTEENTIISSKQPSPQSMYKRGLACVEEKVRRALNLYHEIGLGFDHYKNQCLYDTFIKGLPEFFKWYDIKFEPQNTILTLDYPVLKDLSGYTGVDKIYEFLICIDLEQKFLHAFPEAYIQSTLAGYDAQYEDMIDNLCEIVLGNIVIHIIAKKPLSEPELAEEDYAYAGKILRQSGREEVKRQLANNIEVLVKEYCESDTKLIEYLIRALDNVLVRLENKR